MDRDCGYPQACSGSLSWSLVLETRVLQSLCERVRTAGGVLYQKRGESCPRLVFDYVQQ